MSRKSFVKIERAHRAPTQLKDNRKNPRPIHVAFVRYPDKMKIMANAAARLKNNPFDGNLIGFWADFSKETQERRKALVRFKKHLQKKLEGKECKVFIAYPATLRYLDSKGNVEAVNNEERRKWNAKWKIKNAISRRTFNRRLFNKLMPVFVSVLLLMIKWRHNMVVLWKCCGPTCRRRVDPQQLWQEDRHINKLASICF